MLKLRPVVLTIFANDQDAYLDKLEAEQQAIDNALSPLDDQGFIKLHKENFTSSKRLIELSIRYHSRILLLHYAGHASGTQLSLTDGGGYKKGLADLLKIVPFVFLNGCASKGHVETLLNAGVKAVIATSVAINDTKALEFSTTFYSMLGQGHTLGEAFSKAKEGIDLKYGQNAPVIKRGLKLRKDTEASFEWGLYTSNENIYHWKLPNELHQSVFEKVKGVVNERIQKPNRYLVKNVYKAIRKHSDAALRIRNERKITQPKPNFSEGVQVIGESFLTPISEELRRLFTPERSRHFDILRLKQVITVYERTIELVAYIMLSKLWNDVKTIELAEEQQQYFQTFFELDEYTYPSFNYFEMARYINQVIKEKSLEHFVSEFEDLDFSSDSKFYQSALFLSTIKDELIDIKAELVEPTCKKAEEELTEFLSALYFLVRYKMLVVKNIHIRRLKNQSPQYLHDVIVLDNNKNNTQPDSTIAFNPYTDSDSVILFKDKANLGLNLAPFVIDKNALKKEDNSRIHYFCYTNIKGEYCFLSINDYTMLSIIGEEDDEFDDTESNPFKTVAKQLKHASKDLSGQVLEEVKVEDDGFDDDDDDWDDDF